LNLFEKGVLPRFLWGKEIFCKLRGGVKAPTLVCFKEIKAFTVAEVLARHGVVPLAGEDGISDGLAIQNLE